VDGGRSQNLDPDDALAEQQQNVTLAMEVKGLIPDGWSRSLSQARSATTLSTRAIQPNAACRGVTPPQTRKSRIPAAIDGRSRTIRKYADPLLNTARSNNLLAAARPFMVSFCLRRNGAANERIVIAAAVAIKNDHEYDQRPKTGL